jgi:hypothetical protein
MMIRRVGEPRGPRSDPQSKMATPAVGVRAAVAVPQARRRKMQQSLAPEGRPVPLPEFEGIVAPSGP